MRILRRIAIWAALGLLVGLLGLGFLITIGVSVPLGALRGELEAAASQATGRTVRIGGPIVLVPTFWPTFEVGGVRVSDPPDWPEADFLRAELARLRLNVLPILRGDIHVLEVTAKGVALRLERRADGTPNWLFDTAQTEAEPEPAPSASPSGEGEEPIVFRFDGADELSFEDIQLTYKNGVTGASYDFQLHELSGAVEEGEPTHIDIRGAYQAHPYQVAIDGGPFDTLFDSPEPWPFSLKLEIADTSLELGGQVAGFVSGRAGEARGSGDPEDESLGLTLSLSGERLDSLDEVAEIALPPLGPYSLKAKVDLRVDGYRLDDLAIKVGNSDLHGTMSWNERGEKPQGEVSLAASSIQLDDFDTGDWSLIRSGGEDPAAGAEEEGEPVALLDGSVLRSFDGRLSIRVKEVLSGRDRLGKGSLTATVRDGRLALDPLSIEVPGGSVALQAGFAPTPRDVDLDLAIQMIGFDYGILARRVDPETDMGGEISMDVDLRARAPDVEGLLAQASGYIDVAVWPRDFEAGIFDLWAVNLFSAVMPAVSGEESTVDCVAMLFDVKDGIMTERLILMDTTKMRVGGTGGVDFREETLEFVLAPQPKKPQFFNLATPIEVSGSFDDFGVDVTAADMLGTTLRFLTSVVVVPVESLVRAVQNKKWESCEEIIRTARADRAVAAPPPRQ